MKHFLVEVTYTVSMDQIDAILAAHRAFLQTGYERGWLLMSGGQNPRKGGIIIARAPSLEELQSYFATDPYHLAGAADYRFVEFTPVKRQPWLETWVTGSDLE